MWCIEYVQIEIVSGKGLYEDFIATPLTIIIQPLLVDFISFHSIQFHHISFSPYFIFYFIVIDSNNRIIDRNFPYLRDSFLNTDLNIVCIFL